jgi:hypothetical protein
VKSATVVAGVTDAAMAGNFAVVPIEAYKREVTTPKDWLVWAVIRVKEKVLVVVTLVALATWLIANAKNKMVQLVGLSAAGR